MYQRLKQKASQKLHLSTRSQKPTAPAEDQLGTTQNGQASSKNAIDALRQENRATEKDEEASSQLWTRAYKNLQTKHKDLVDSYDACLKKEMVAAWGESTKPLLAVLTPVVNFAVSDEMLISTMGKFTADFLAKQEKHEALEDGLQEAAEIIVSLKDTVGEVLSAHPAAGLAWGLLCAAMPCLVKILTARKDMKDGLKHVIGQIGWYMTLAPLLLKKTFAKGHDMSKLQDTLEEKIVSLYEDLLLYQINCAVAACHWIKSTVKAAMGITNWSASLISIKEHEEYLDGLRNAASTAEIIEHLRGMSRHHDEESAGKKQDLIGRLRSTDYESLMKRNTGRVDQTCEWFPKHQEFLQWIDGAKDVLVVSADPGCGKSVLARYIVEDVFPLYKPKAICYFFFKLDSEHQEPASALCAILHNLFSNNPDLFSPECEEGITKAGDRLTQDLASLWKIFELAMKRHERGTIYCVLDALDECAPSALESFTQAIQDLLKKVRSTGTQFQRQPRLKFLCTTRGYARILDNFEPDTTLKINFGNDEVALANIQKDIWLVVDKSLENLGQKMGWDEPKLRQLRKALVTLGRRQRTYLWVKLAFDVLRHHSITVSDDLEDLLSNVPQNVAEAYEALLDRVLDDDIDAVWTVLHLIIAAVQPLTLRELNIALSVRKRTGAKSEAHLRLAPDEKFQMWLTETFSFFLHIDSDKKVYFQHLTAREFLMTQTENHPLKAAAPDTRVKWKGSITERAAHSVMAESCIAYLSMKHFTGTYFRTVVEEAFPAGNFRGDGYDHLATNGSGSGGLTDGLDEIGDLDNFEPDILVDGSLRDEVLQSYSLLTYVCSHWLEHFRAAQLIEGTTVIEDVETIYLEPYFALFAGADLSVQPWFRISLFFIRREHLLTAFEAEAIILDTASHLAAFSGHLRLLQRCLQPSHSSSYVAARYDGTMDQTLIHWASYGGSRECVSYLLEQGHRTDFQLPNSGRQPLFWAAMNCHFQTLDFLTNPANMNRAEVNHRDKSNHTALSYVSWCLKDPDFHHRWESLSQVFRFLVSRGADVTQEHSYTRTILHFLATRTGPEDDDADAALEGATYESMKVPRGDGRFTRLAPPQIALLDAYDESLVKVCVDHGANIEASTSERSTPLHYAANTLPYGSRPWPLIFLLHAGASTKCRDQDGETPLHIAARRENLVAARVLLLYGDPSDAISKDNEKNTPLHLLARHTSNEEAYEIAKALIQADGQTGQQMHTRRKAKPSAKAKHPSKGLPSAKADTNLLVNAQNNNGLTPLHVACMYQAEKLSDEHIRFVTLLLENKADVNLVDVGGVTQLHLAVTKRYSSKVVRLLLGKDKSSINAQTIKYKSTPLHYAVDHALKRDMVETVGLLLEHGADPSIQDAEGRTPLHDLCRLRALTWDLDSITGEEQITIARMMLEKGANAFQPDLKQCTPLDQARDREMAELVELMEGWPEQKGTAELVPEKRPLEDILR